MIESNDIVWLIVDVVDSLSYVVILLWVVDIRISISVWRVDVTVDVDVIDVKLLINL